MREFRRIMTRHLSDPSSPLRKPRTRNIASRILVGPDSNREEALRKSGCRLVAGVDEAGRGPLAGPVVAAAAILDPEHIPAGLNDSKKLTAGDRERLFEEILRFAVVGVGSASASEIDEINIRQATFAAMRRALAGLAVKPDHALIDGRDVPPKLPCLATAVIGGDAASLSIAAASIVAKVVRDRMMHQLGLAFPLYGFGAHMGYGTPAHLTAIRTHGPCLHHRRTFAPVREQLMLGI
ncbi:ribonuclease HII [Aureimonas sp. ME7]|uniref:ribonuclease HII n=1 Tax=Aureimonas sp. ME7 TaxID=2744252 RepID=UPI0015F53414|nr:ribonuclease HII [Aureimonas sp. ME7]